MGAVFSNFLKVLMLPVNILESDMTQDGANSVTTQSAQYSQSECITVQSFEYNFERTCNGKGIPFGVTTNPTVEFALNFMSEVKAKAFIEKINSMSIDEFTFLFNTSFDENRKVDNFENAIVVRGYVVELEQTYSSVEASGGKQQMELRIKILASDVTFAGSMTNKTLFISKM